MPAMLATLAYAVSTLLVLLFANRGLRRLRARAEGTGAAAGIVEAAEVFSVFLIAAGVASGCAHGEEVGDDILWIAAFGLTAIVAFDLSAWFGIRVLAGGAVWREVQRDNRAAAVFAAGHVVATGLLAANLFAGTAWGDLGQAAGFFLLAQLSLHALVWLFRLLTAYDDDAQVLEHNHAAALSHAGVSVAMALLIAHAADGPFVGLAASLGNYGVALLEGLAFYVVRQVIVQCVILRARPTLRGGEIDRAIGERADVGAGALEAATYVATALLVRSLV
jgi:uncharacterized membrane protein YjfL (UPF0719 family)